MTIKSHEKTGNGQAKDPVSFCTNSNRPGQVFALSVLPNFASVRRPFDSNLQQYKDLIIQTTAATSWFASRKMGVI